MLTLVRNDEGDWIGLYGHDGRLIEEGHSFEASQVLELAGVAHDVVCDVDLSEGRLPSSLGAVASLPPEKKERREVRP
jgi:hypothetical protein